MPEETKLVGEARPQRPRSPRVPVDFAVKLSGQNPDGAPFEVAAEAVKVSRGGATLLTDAIIKVGDVVHLTPRSGARWTPWSTACG